MKLSYLIRLISYLIISTIFDANAAPDESYSAVSLGAFSTDGSKLSISFCNTGSICKFGYVDLQRRRFVEIFPNDKDQVWSPGGFSPSGEIMAVSIRRKSEKGSFSQIGIVSLTTSHLTQMTHGEVYKSSPSFSHDGKKIIFAQANRERKSGATRFSAWDIYEITVDGRDERRLTANAFYQASRPAYLPGGKQFIFSGDAPSAYKSAVGMQAYYAYKNEHQDNTIFVLSLDQDSLQLKPFFYHDVFSDFPSISANGSRILYRARTDKEDGIKTRFVYELFLFDGASHRRMTHIGGHVTDSVLSPKGDQVAFVAEKLDQRKKRYKIYLLDIERGQTATLDFTASQ